MADADVGLLAALLRAANSAASAPMSPIGTARNATVRIGTEEARRIILATAANETFRSARRSGLNLHDVWGHLFATAVIADHLALASVEHSEAFSAGLLHDLGRLAMAANQSDRFRSVIGAVRRGADPRAAERELFGVDHVEWGVEVAQAWHFPESVVQGIAGHHEGAQGGIGWIVRRAREVSLILGLGDGVREADETEVSTEARMLPVISELGGPAEMHRQITWYRGALVV